MATASASIPTFYLYGEPQRSVDEGFVHVESLDDRSRPSEWTIRPHVHRDLNHFIVITEGGGSMVAEGERFSFDSPCILLVPAGLVHGFAWHRESSGWVTTIADSYLRDLLQRDADLPALFRKPRAVPLPAEDHAAVEKRIGRMARELNWSGPGQRAAVEATLLSLMVLVLRRATLDLEDRTIGRSTPALVARLRQRIEQRFRAREPVAVHARALGVSETRLRQACARIAARSPAAMLDDRAMLEARRLLLYSNLSVAEIGHAIGLDDPAYFSRFFTRRAGQSPSAWRAASRREATGGWNGERSG